MKAKIEHFNFPAGKRILCISDIHGNLPYLQGLLDKAGFSSDDELVIVGDLLEKGPDSLATLRFVMTLYERGNVHVLSGNCDDWHDVIDDHSLALAEGLRNYLAIRPGGLIGQMCAAVGFSITPPVDVDALREAIGEPFRKEFDVLRSLPTVIETPHYTFVHGGLPEGDPENWTAWNCMKYDNFMGCGRSFDKWVICGHWPVMLYHEDTVEANPVFDYDKKIISIDGGCVLKDDGQLNALVIPYDGSEDFSHMAYDPFPKATVLQAQQASQRSWYIRWGDAKVRVLERGEEFCRCRHLRTGYEMDILTKYVYGDGEECSVNDCTDYVLPLSPGDEVSVVEISSRGYFVKHRGVSGWYRGPLKWSTRANRA